MCDRRRALFGVLVAVAVGCGSRDEQSSSAPPSDPAPPVVVAEPADADPAPAGESPPPGEEWPATAPPEDSSPGAAYTAGAESPTGEAVEPPVPTTDALPLPPAAAAPQPPADEPPPIARDAPPAPADEPTGEIATRPETTDDHVVRVFYATDREPLSLNRAAPVTWRHYLPAIAAALVSLLASLGVLFLPRKTLFAIGALAAAAATAALGQSAVVRAQQLERAAAFGDRTYGSGRHEEAGRPVLELGVCEVAIPPDHRVGEVESPSVLRLEFREDPQKHVVLERIVRLLDDEFFDSLRSTVAASSAGQALVFVHGYNVGFDDAVKRTAQIAYDLRFDGAAVCYSWPSHAGLARYTYDEANVAWTVTQLEAFLRSVVERSGARTVHLVAHSMGNRALVQAIERLALRGDGPRFGHVVLAAPDVDTGEFRTRYAPALAQVARRVTLYASSNDRALLASTRVHGYTRAGLSGEHLVVVPGLDTIDVSPIDTSLIGHSYYGDNPLMIRDLGAVIGLDLPADGREWLRRTLLGEAFYWAFRPELITGGP